jgi:heme oxygenase
MRNLTAKQKKILDKFIQSQLNKQGTFEREMSLFKGGKHFLDIDDLPSEIYAEIEAINDTEILYQNVDRYLGDKCFEIK